MDTTLSPVTGQLLDGRYQVESRLAHGGMATVYLGRDTRLDRVLALKIAHPELASDQEFVRRFMTEARAVAQLSSPHVVAVYDQGSAGDLHYIAMEYVAGPTLREVLNARGSLSVRESLDVIEGVLAGLAAAHRAGIIHRDVKPENVLLGTDGAVKVADFGLARAAAAATHTKTGMIIGTAAYLAPEQVSASTSDARTDVYAAGVMLFEMLTGAQPHTGESPLAVAYKHVTDVVPPPSSLVPGLPPALDALVALATSRDPDLRPADAGQFLHAVSEVRRGTPLSAARRGEHAAPGGALAVGSGLMADSGLTADELADTDLGPAVGGPAYGGPAYGSPDYGSAAYGGPAYGSPDYGGPDYGSPGVGSRGLRGASYNGTGLDGPGRNGTGADATEAMGIGTAGRNGFAGRHSLTSGPGGGGTGGPLSAGGAQDDSYRPANHTLVVSAGAILPGFDDPGDGRRGRRAYDRQPDHEPPLQRLLFSRRLFYVLGTLAVVLLAVLLGWWLTSGQYTSVPQVTGWSVGLARTELTGLGFKVHDGAGQHSNVPAGHIVRTSPKAGTSASNGATITLTLSLGPVTVRMPSITGQPLQQAQQELRQAGLKVGPLQQTPSTTIAAGIVISTNPVANTAWPKDKPVSIAVSAGPPLPNFVGGQVSAAQQAAQAGGYQINPVQDPNKSNQPANTVTRQSPAANTPIQSGEVVTVYFSAGPPPTNVPNVQGMTSKQAQQALQAAGFQVNVNKVGPGDRVFNYSPTGQAPPGSTITINVGFSFF
ncbi:MAG TPA: PASTA domain-containing protein [Streptosporangiaceae bacterium]|nr:PASTA domain-containing protein [Streptosporangiaceae bacterium]